MVVLATLVTHPFIALTYLIDLQYFRFFFFPLLCSLRLECYYTSTHFLPFFHSLRYRKAVAEWGGAKFHCQPRQIPRRISIYQSIHDLLLFFFLLPPPFLQPFMIIG